MSATDKRVEDLLERWLASVDLHLRYLKLDDAAYERVESWPQHQRPNALVVNLARTRLLELKAHLAERRDAGDTKFAESLELMSFVTSLLGSEHIERFIPLATGKTPAATGNTGTIEQPRLRATSKTGASQRATGHRPSASTQAGPNHKTSTASHKRAPRTAASEGSAGTPSNHTANGDAPRTTRETVSRQLVAARPRPAAATSAPARTEPASAARAGAGTVVPEPASTPPPQDATARQVIADAIRMLEWGREWPAVAGLIARMADRPSEAEIWKILRAHRADILARARRGAT